MPATLPPRVPGPVAAAVPPEAALPALESIRDAFYIVDADWRIVFFNAFAERHFGLPREAVLGRDLWEAFPQAVGSSFETTFRTAMRDRVAARVESPSVRGGGRWVEVDANPCGDGLACQVRDVTERRRAVDALAASEHTLRLALDAAHLGLFEWRPGKDAVEWSARTREILGVAPDAPLDRALRRRIVHPDDAPRVAAARARALDPEGEGRLRVEHRVLRPDGSLRWIAVHGSRIGRPDGEPRLLGVIEDVTARKRAETRRRRREDRLEEDGRRKDEFLAMLSHELRNPLAPLTNALHLLHRSPALGERDRSLLQIAERQRAQLARLVDDLLDVSRVTRGKIGLRPAPVRAGDAVRDAVESVAGMLRTHGQRLELDLPEPSPTLRADPVRLVQILGNLLHNAAKYGGDGGTVRLSVRAEDEAVRFEVADDGIGIEPDRLEQLFEPFTQLESGLDRAQGGLGIGLALVRRLAELHGGDASAHSDGPGKGATFAVRLPVAGPASVASEG
ncbi:MAG TPA: PAS domain-containing sensor histidine kinase [Burkholderiaceae bacterium]|nr:PAS domain-containing sensor histidine kinase [Burkholderiaceae bacterium]